MRLSSTIALLTAIAVPRINGSSIASNIRDHENDNTNGQEKLCEFMTNFDDDRCTFECDEYFSYMQYRCEANNEYEMCDNEGEFCTMYPSNGEHFNIGNLTVDSLFTDDEVMTYVSYDFCSVYTRAPEPFEEKDILDKTSCITIYGMVDFSTILTNPEVTLEICEANIGGEQCDCNLCDEDFSVEVHCNNLNLEFENGCIQMYGDEASDIRLKLIEDHQDDCSHDEEVFTINIATDMYGEDISWNLDMNTRGNQFDLHTRNSGKLEGETYYEENICIPEDTCFKFFIYDEVNDGLCCNHSHGQYSLFLQGEMLKYSIYSNSAEYEETVFGSSGKLC